MEFTLPKLADQPRTDRLICESFDIQVARKIRWQPEHDFQRRPGMDASSVESGGMFAELTSNLGPAPVPSPINGSAPGLDSPLPAMTKCLSPAPVFTTEERRSLLEVEALPLMDLIYAVARRMVGDDARAEDLVQETYLRAIRSCNQYTPGTNCKAWLLTILRSAYIDASRQSRARQGVHEQLPPDLSAREDRTDLPIDPARFMSILDVMVDDDIRSAMLQVPELYREAFVLVVIGELPYKEAAAILGVQEGTAKSRVFRACRILKSRLWSYAKERRLSKEEAPPEAG